MKATNDSTTHSNQKNTTVGYGYFAEYPYPELLDKFRSLFDHGINPEPIWSFINDRESIFTLIRYSSPDISLGKVPKAIYSRRIER